MLTSITEGIKIYFDIHTGLIVFPVIWSIADGFLADIYFLLGRRRKRG